MGNCLGEKYLVYELSSLLLNSKFGVYFLGSQDKGQGRVLYLFTYYRNTTQLWFMVMQEIEFKVLQPLA